MEDISQLTEKGLAALRGGRVRDAVTAFSEAVNRGADSSDALRGLAIAARASDQPKECLEAAERLLRQNADNVEALLFKADALKMSGDTRKASAAYFAAVNAAQRQPGLHPSFHKEIERAKAECAAAAAQYEAHIRDKAANAGLMDGSGRARSEQAIDLMFGRKQVYYQQPEKFLFPELPQIQFYNPDDFSWKDDLIAATSTIQSELEAVLSSPIDFEPYVPADTDSQQLRANRLCGNTDWGAFHLRKDGVRVEANASKCPQTLEALKQTPQPVVKGKSPIALFSRLTPGAHIPPHTGLMNTRLICHLPLVTPDGCSLRVGNQERQWRQGEMLIFDDSIEHEAQNTGSSDRIILLFDIWRPELSEEERSFIAMIFEAIEDYGVLI